MHNPCCHKFYKLKRPYNTEYAFKMMKNSIFPFFILCRSHLQHRKYLNWKAQNARTYNDFDKYLKTVFFMFEYMVLTIFKVQFCLRIKNHTYGISFMYVYCMCFKLVGFHYKSLNRKVFSCAMSGRLSANTLFFNSLLTLSYKLIY